MRRGFNFCFVNIYSILKLDINNEYKSTIFLQNYILILGAYYSLCIILNLQQSFYPSARYLIQWKTFILIPYNRHCRCLVKCFRIYNELAHCTSIFKAVYVIFCYMLYCICAYCISITIYS